MSKGSLPIPAGSDIQFGPTTNFHVNVTRRRTLYFIGCGGYLKIGIATDLEKRMRNLAVGNPLPLVLEGQISIPACLSVQIEKQVHAALSSYKHQGEWFAVDLATAREAAEPIVAAAEMEEARLQAKTGRYTPCENWKEMAEASKARMTESGAFDRLRELAGKNRVK